MNSLAQLLDICKAVAMEKDLDKLLGKILDAAMEISNCDAGTLYLVENEFLCFKIMRNHEIPELNGTSHPDMPPVPLNSTHNICSIAMRDGIINIADAYSCREYDLSGTIQYDSRSGYRTGSVLVVPVVTKSGEKVGVLQLFNCLDEETGYVTVFSPDKEVIVEALASQISLVLQNAQYESKLALVKESLHEQIDGSHIPSGVLSDLLAYLNQNYYGNLSERDIRQAISEESDVQIVSALTQKQLRKRQDSALPFIPRDSAAEAALVLERYTGSRKKPNALAALQEYLYSSVLSNAEIAERANMYPGTLSGIVSGKRPLKKHNLCTIAIALGLRLEEAEELLQLNGESFQGCSKTDLVLQYFLKYNETAKQPCYMHEINDILYEMGENMLGIDPK